MLTRLGPRLLDVGLAAEGHAAFDLGAQELDDAVDAVGAVDGEAPEKGAADADGAGAEGQGLDDVAAAADAGIDVDLGAAGGSLDDFGQHFDGAHEAVHLASAVGGDQDGVDAVLDGEVGVLAGADTLEY